MRLFGIITHAILKDRTAMDTTQKNFELEHQVVKGKSLLDLKDTRSHSCAYEES